MNISQTASSHINFESLLRGISFSDGTKHTSWGDIADRASKLADRGLGSTPQATGQVAQLSGLLKMQVEVTRYQLRVELVSKVSESAVATLRKLQQNQ
jgi:hypothetical protein